MHTKSLISLSLLVLTACATAPAQYQFDNSRSFEVGLDEVWPEVVNFFAENNLPISTVERDSGLIVADDLRFSMAEFAQYADCGQSPLATESNARGSVNLFVRERSTDGSTLTVNTRFQVYREVGTPGTTIYGASYVDCVSNGTLENAIMERIATSVNLPTVDVQVTQ